MALKRVTVALGGSEYMNCAVAEACQIAARNGAEIVGLTVLDQSLVDPVQAAPIGGGAAAADLRDQRTEQVRQGMDDAATTFKATCESLSVSHRVTRIEGDAQEAVTEALRLSDLGIMGIRHAFDYGTIAHADDFLARAAHASNRPILAMTPPARPIRRVLIAYDGSHVSAGALRSFAVLNAFAPDLVRVVCCREGDEAVDEIVAEARSYLELHGYAAETAVLEGSPSEAILEHAKGFAADLIVAGAVGRRGLSKLLAGDTASAMLAESDIPLYLRR